MKKFLLITAAALFFSTPVMAQDYVLYNGKVFTATDQTKATAIVVSDGIIKYVGNDKAALKLLPKAKKINAAGNTIMPGLIDAHMHPQSGGLRMSGCSLNYLSLTMDEMNARIQKCLDEDKDAGPNDWLVVAAWFEQEMKPTGFVPNYKDFDALKTTRPIFIRNSFGHAAQLNRKAVELIDLKNQKERAGGMIVRDKDGNPTGRLEEAARDIVFEILPPPTEKQNLVAAQTAIKAMNAQGITSIFDAYTDIETMTAYQTIQKAGELTLRPHFAVLVDLDKEPNMDKAVDEVLRERKMFDQGKAKVQPSLSVHSAKIFLDGTNALPSLTGAMLEPYFEEKDGKWVQGANYGVKPYIETEKLSELMLKLTNAGIDTHIHTDGDRAVRVALDATEKMQENFRKQGKGDPMVRTALAHCELVAPEDFGRFKKLGVLPVLSFQWERPAADTWEGSKDVFGPKRFALIEPAGYLHDAGAKIVYGSDWPVDPLDEWLAIQIGVTRMALPEDRAKYPERLGKDPGLSLDSALKAITINAAYSLHSEKYTGSLEKGKYADIIVLDRDLFKTKADEISKTKVKMTFVGGKLVYEGK
ncbi:amidohydrolase [Pseudaquidulcibacter saccharophilus]|uniref:amidohydrolase n=1 Tax=Pseudaquidulcibacter saccharophilus TaxID=2831900 RepID=UPI001EFF252B|nr:amidohydrolase [Pseudaquidulcibacter saccharophilus]